ncbi:IQ domain-containing protein IQM2-like [Diospyros lotus]|uniref:IQ domain-containing protein IQM2-like n=1 Tax=Diospyros lotus TaxID=55363 RepID=UPI0022540C27|nr:IQ domain-containing protein IQM2-like [Diospyros lotus]
MGINFSCPFALYNDLEHGFESVIAESITLKDDNRAQLQSIGSKGRDWEPTISQSKDSQNMTVEGHVCSKTTETETEVSIEASSIEGKDLIATWADITRMEMDNQSPRSASTAEKTTGLPVLDLSSPKHEAALKLQKVYKSFRTRRKLADCAVLIEQSWWKLLDFAELKRSSISFFDIEKHETAISRWSRARTRVAKVGKGLSKNNRAQKLALQHWLEAIDPRHRYGHNLHFYYDKWLHCQSKEPFFYWLDIGEGKEVNLVDKCPRSKLLQQCIRYLGPKERKAYEVEVVDGRLLYKQSGVLLNTVEEPKGAKWIFVLSTSMTLYIGQKKKGTFQHSSFLAGGATSAAGRIVVEKGILKAIWPHSGHYRPTPENFQDFISFLRVNNVELTDVKMDPVDDEEESVSKKSSVFLRCISSEEDVARKNEAKKEQMDAENNKDSEESNSTEEEEDAAAAAAASSEPLQPSPSSRHRRNLTNLSIPDRDELVERLKFEDQSFDPSAVILEAEESSAGAEQYQMVTEENLSEEDKENNEEESVPKESILKRINSHKRMNSFQLGKQLSCKWTTGAGPRIGCVRDYPSKLQFDALEQVNLSPRSARASPSRFRSSSSSSSQASTPNSFISAEIHATKTSFCGELSRIRLYTPQSSPLRKATSGTGGVLKRLTQEIG